MLKRTFVDTNVNVIGVERSEHYFVLGLYCEDFSHLRVFLLRNVSGMYKTQDLK